MQILDTQDILTMFPELAKIANIESVLFQILMSEDMSIDDFKNSNCC